MPQDRAARQRQGGRILTSTTQATNLIADMFYTRRDFLNAHTDTISRFVAGWMAAAALMALLAAMAASVLLTWHQPTGQRHLALGIGSDHLFTLFFAALVWLMAHVIGQGQALAQENAAFV